MRVGAQRSTVAVLEGEQQEDSAMTHRVASVGRDVQVTIRPCGERPPHHPFPNLGCFGDDDLQAMGVVGEASLLARTQLLHSSVLGFLSSAFCVRGGARSCVLCFCVLCSMVLALWVSGLYPQPQGQALMWALAKGFGQWALATKCAKCAAATSEVQAHIPGRCP